MRGIAGVMSALVFTSYALPGLPAAAAPVRSLSFAGTGRCDVRTGEILNLLPDETVFAALSVNGRDQGARVVALVDGEPWLRVADLYDAGVKVLRTTTARMNGDTFASLRAACGAIGYRYDGEAGDLSVSVDARSFAPQTISGMDDFPDARVPITAERSAYLDYSLQRSTATGVPAVTTGTTNAVFGAFGGVVHVESAFAAQSATTAYAVFDDESHGRGATVGQIAPAGGQTGSALSLVGALFESRPDLEPYQPHRPLPTLTGVAQTATTAQIYVNGVLTRTVDLNPGPFTVQDIGAMTGSGTARIVFTDALGQRSFDTTFSGEGDLLRRGSQEYQFAAGVPRYDASTAAAPVAGGFTALLRERVGVTDWSTVGARAESNRDVADGSVSIDTTNGVAAFHLVAAASDAHGVRGSSTILAAQRAFGAHVVLAAQLASTSDRYSTLTQTPAMDRVRSSATGSMTLGLGRSNLTFAATRQTYRDAGSESTFQANAFRSLTRAASAFVSWTSTQFRPTGAPRQAVSWALSAGITLMMSGNRSARIGTNSTPQATRSAASFTRAEAPSGGLSYDASLDGGAGGDASGYLQYRGPYFETRLDRYQSGGHADGSLTVSGSVVASHDVVAAGPPIGDSFAIVETGLPGLRVDANGQYVGTTRRDGLLVVPTAALFATHLSASLQDTPDNVDLDSGDVAIRARRGTGVLVRQPGRILHGVQGHFSAIPGALPGATLVTATRGKQRYSSVLGYENLFYFARLEPGRWTLSVVTANGRCAAEVTSPARAMSLTDVGTVVCK